MSKSWSFGNILRVLKETEAPLTAISLISSALKLSLKYVIVMKLSKYHADMDHGQFVIHFSSYRIEFWKNEIFATNLVHQHFARLEVIGKENNCVPVPLYRDINDLKHLQLTLKDGSLCTLRSVYNSYEADELIYLMLLGLEDVSPISFTNVPVTSRRWTDEMFKKFYGSIRINKPDEDPRDGMYLECLNVLSSIRSSHGSLEGTDMKSFLLKYIQELSLKPLDLKWDNCGYLSEFSDLIVPYLPPQDAICSAEFQQIPGVYTGVIRSTEDSEIVDSVLMPYFVFHLSSLRNNQPEFEAWHRKYMALLGTRLGADLSSGLFSIISEQKNYADGIDEATICSIGIRAAENFEHNFSSGLIKKQLFIILTSRVAMSLKKESIWFKLLNRKCRGVNFSKVVRNGNFLYVEHLFTTKGKPVCPRLVLIVPTETLFNEKLTYHD